MAEHASRAPQTDWCWWCMRAVRLDDGEAFRVATATGDVWVCGDCWTLTSPPVPVDYTKWTESEKREAFGK